MSISGIGSYQTFATVSPNQTQPASAVESDGDTDRGRVSAPADASGRSGLFASAISQTLFQIGVTPVAANVATGATLAGPQQQALDSFVQNLFGALQGSGSGNNVTGANGKPAAALRRDAKGNASAPGDNALTASSADEPSLPAAYPSGNQPQATGIGSNLESRLQNLTQQTSSENPSPAGPDSINQSLSSLQQSFQDLLSAQGVDGSQVPLVTFLQTLSRNLQDAPPTGNVISITA